MYDLIQLLSSAARVNGKQFCFLWDVGFVLFYLFFFLSFMKVREPRYLKLHIEDPRSGVQQQLCLVHCAYTFGNYLPLWIKKGKCILLTRESVKLPYVKGAHCHRSWAQGFLPQEEGEDITSHIATEACFRKRGRAEGGERKKWEGKNVF